MQGGREVVRVENAATVLAIHQRDDSPPLSVHNGVALVSLCSHHVHFVHGQKAVLHIRHNGQENLARIGINIPYNVPEHDAVGIAVNQIGGKKRRTVVSGKRVEDERCVVPSPLCVKRLARVVGEEDVLRLVVTQQFAALTMGRDDA